MYSYVCACVNIFEHVGVRQKGPHLQPGGSDVKEKGNSGMHAMPH